MVKYLYGKAGDIIICKPAYSINAGKLDRTTQKG